MSDKKEKEFLVEEAFVELEEIITKLESDKTSLNEAMKLYNAGIGMINKCKTNLEGVEKEIVVLSNE